jgi:lipid-binding SYLF domain-containing protein
MAWGQPRLAFRGARAGQFVFIINSDRALRGIEIGNVKLGTGAGITEVNLSSGAEGAVTANGGDVVVRTSGSGAYAGVSFNGSVIKADTDETATPVSGPEARGLRRNLSSVL